MLERPYLRVECIAHHVQPGACNVGIVPCLLDRGLVRKHFGQCFVIPLLRMVQDHRYRLEIATTGRLCETLHQRVEMRGSGGRERRLGGRCSRLDRRRKTNRARGHGQSERSQYVPSSGDHLHVCRFPPRPMSFGRWAAQLLETIKSLFMGTTVIAENASRGFSSQ